VLIIVLLIFLIMTLLNPTFSAQDALKVADKYLDDESLGHLTLLRIRSDEDPSSGYDNLWTIDYFNKNPININGGKTYQVISIDVNNFHQIIKTRDRMEGNTYFYWQKEFIFNDSWEPDLVLDSPQAYRMAKKDDDFGRSGFQFKTITVQPTSDSYMWSFNFEKPCWFACHPEWDELYYSVTVADEHG